MVLRWSRFHNRGPIRIERLAHRRRGGSDHFPLVRCIPNRQSVSQSASSVEGSILFPKSSHPDSRRQKQPECRQHRLNDLRLPHGHGSLRPSFSSSSFSPWTIRTPRLTLLSEGNPRRRLLIGSKKGIFRRAVAHFELLHG